MKVGPLCCLDCEAQSVLDLAGDDRLVVANQAGKNRQPGRVSRCPAIRPKLVRLEVENCPRAAMPARPHESRVPRLVEPAAIPVNDEDVPITS